MCGSLRLRRADAAHPRPSPTNRSPSPRSPSPSGRQQRRLSITNTNNPPQQQQQQQLPQPPQQAAPQVCVARMSWSWFLTLAPRLLRLLTRPVRSPPRGYAISPLCSGWGPHPAGRRAASRSLRSPICLAAKSESEGSRVRCKSWTNGPAPCAPSSTRLGRRAARCAGTVVTTTTTTSRARWKKRRTWWTRWRRTPSGRQ